MWFSLDMPVYVYYLCQLKEHQLYNGNGNQNSINKIKTEINAANQSNDEPTTTNKLWYHHQQTETSLIVYCVSTG